MIPKLIRLGVENILKIICERIIIKNIKVVNKHNTINRKIDELYIKAESIIFNKINISNINIHIRDIIFRFPLNNKKLFIDNFNAEINMILTKDNINKTLFNNKWKRLKNSIEAFIAMSFESIEINNKSIYFIPSDTLSNKNVHCTLRYDRNTISLVNNINQEKLSILNDRNIIVNNLYFSESNIELDLSSKVIFS